MREPPDLPNEAVIAFLESSYGISVGSLEFLPIGQDSAAWTYRVESTDGSAYFLKVRTGRVNEPGLVVPRYLGDRGLEHVIAPLSTTDGVLWSDLGDFALILYPFIGGRTGTEGGLTEDQWVEFGTAVKRIHTTPLTPDILDMLEREQFAPKWDGVIQDWDAVRRLDDYVSGASFADPIERELAEFWRARAREIRSLVDRGEYLGKQLQQAAQASVLCHADLHTWNVLIDSEHHLWIVDWDEIVLAPKERDLMFVVGGISRSLVGPRAEELFLRGYGEVEIDPLALAYYRHMWAVQDIGGYAEQVFLRPDLGALTKRAAVEICVSLFEPGEIVELAYESDAGVAYLPLATAPSDFASPLPHAASSVRTRARAAP